MKHDSHNFGRSRGFHPQVEKLEERCNPDGSFGAWSAPVNLGSVVNTASSDQHPAISKDGLSLYITTNRPENADDLVLDDNIWVSQRASVNPRGRARGTWRPSTRARTTCPDFVPQALDVLSAARAAQAGSMCGPATGKTSMMTPGNLDQPRQVSPLPMTMTNILPGRRDRSCLPLLTSFNRAGNIGDWDIYMTPRTPPRGFQPAFSMEQRASRTATATTDWRCSHQQPRRSMVNRSLAFAALTFGFARSPPIGGRQ